MTIQDFDDLTKELLTTEELELLLSQSFDGDSSYGADLNFRVVAKVYATNNPKGPDMGLYLYASSAPGGIWVIDPSSGGEPFSVSYGTSLQFIYGYQDGIKVCKDKNFKPITVHELYRKLGFIGEIMDKDESFTALTEHHYRNDRLTKN